MQMWGSQFADPTATADPGIRGWTRSTPPCSIPLIPPGSSARPRPTRKVRWPTRCSPLGELRIHPDRDDADLRLADPGLALFGSWMHDRDFFGETSAPRSPTLAMIALPIGLLMSMIDGGLWWNFGLMSVPGVIASSIRGLAAVLMAIGIISVVTELVHRTWMPAAGVLAAVGRMSPRPTCSRPSLHGGHAVVGPRLVRVGGPSGMGLGLATTRSWDPVHPVGPNFGMGPMEQLETAELRFRPPSLTRGERVAVSEQRRETTRLSSSGRADAQISRRPGAGPSGPNLAGICSGYVNQKIAVTMGVPEGREAVLDLFDASRSSRLERLRQYEGEYALESEDVGGTYNWVALRTTLQKPEHTLDEAYRLHRSLLDIAPICR